MFSLHLHCPHEPPHSIGACLIGVNLGQEEVLQKLNMISSIIREISIVNFAGLIISCRVIGSDISSLEVLLTISDSIGELSSEDWQLTEIDIMSVSAGLSQVQLPPSPSFCPWVVESLIVMSINDNVAILI